MFKLTEMLVFLVVYTYYSFFNYVKYNELCEVIMSMQDTFNEDDIDDLIEEGVVENVYN